MEPTRDMPMRITAATLETMPLIAAASRVRKEFGDI